MKSVERDIVLAVVLFLIALMTSVLFADGRYAFEPDGARWLNIGRNLADNQGAFVGIIRETSGIPNSHPSGDFTKPPLFGILLAALVKLGLDAKVAGWMISQVSFAIAALALYGLARFALPKLPAFVAAILFSFQVSSLKWSIFVREDMLFLAATLLSLFLLVLLRETETDFRQTLWFCLGVFVGAALLTRYVGIALVITVSGFILVDVLFHRRVSLKPLFLFSLGVDPTHEGGAGILLSLHP